MTYHVVGIGNAIVDILAQVEEKFLFSRNIPKGAMTLIDAEAAEKLYNDMGECEECAGGSVANTIAALAQLGAKTAFMGRVKNDALGTSFRESMRSTGATFDTEPVKKGSPTGRCFVCVTPDAERTMNTFIGACAEFASEDVDMAVIADSDVLYIEGYLWDQTPAKAAISKAVKAAKANNTKVALSLSDIFCVDRHRESFMALIEESVDILFANEQEATILTETASIADAGNVLAKHVDIAAITQGEHGVTVFAHGEALHVNQLAIDKVIDTTGAGDTFAAGFLYGLSQSGSYETAARMGNAMAGKIVQQMGARGEFSVEELAA